MATTLPTPVLDHVVINVRDDLDAAAERYRALGFTLTPRGHHTLGSSNNLAMFGTDYLELLGFERGRPMTRPEIIDHPVGLTGLVFKTADAAATAAALRSRGLNAPEPLAFSRPVALPEGARDAAFRVVPLPADRIVNGRSFFCEHLTPDVVWRPEWQSHANGVTGIRRFVIAGVDPARTASVYGDAFGAEIMTEVEGGLLFRAGVAEVLVLTPTAAAARWPETASIAGGGDRMVLLGLATSTPSAVPELLSAAGLPFRPEGAVTVVPPSACFGVVLAFEG